MFKISIIFVITLAGICLSQPNQTALKLCNTVNCPKGQSIACQYVTNPNIKCRNGKILKINQNAIVDYHNNKRNLVASGKLPRYQSAVEMQTMSFSPELAQMAEYNVKTCKFGHDKCRNTNTFKQSGQNLYTVWGSAPFNTDINKLIRNGMDSWFNEHKDADMSYIRSYRSAPKQIGHFTAMIKFNSNFIGCSASEVPDKTNKRVIFACNYASTNIIGRPIYVPGRTASKCRNGTNPKYPALCKP